MKAPFLLGLLFALFSISVALAQPKQPSQIISNNSGMAANAGRDIYINSNIYKSADYESLKQDVEEAKKQVVQANKNIQKYPNDSDFVKQLLQTEEELQEALNNFNNFKDNIRKIYTDIDKLSLNSERGIKVMQLFEKGKYQAARDVLNAKEMRLEQRALLKRKKQLIKKQDEINVQLNSLAGEFILKAKLTAIDYQLGKQRVPQTRHYFELALKSGRPPKYLFKYAFFLQESSKFSDSEKLYLETLEAYRKLAKKNPVVYLPSMASTLNNLGNLLQTDSSRRNESEKLYQEALTIYRKLAEGNPAVYQPDVASTLNNLGHLLAKDSARRNESERLFREALTICHRLVKKNSVIFQPDMAYTLVSFGYAYLIWRNREQAIFFSQEAHELYSTLARRSPKVFAEKLKYAGMLLKKAQGDK